MARAKIAWTDCFQTQEAVLRVFRLRSRECVVSLDRRNAITAGRAVMLAAQSLRPCACGTSSG